tara:strand:- start:2085 stop:2576 length:492 start_codon:yes stop_codon:yes gene_type:complete
MDFLLVYSNKCPHSNRLKSFDVFTKLNKLNIDEPENLKNIPDFINTVPVLVIKENNNLSILKENNLLQWFVKNSNKSEKQSSKKDEGVLELNMLDNSFSSNFTFLDGENDNILENNYSNLNSDNNNSIQSEVNVSTKKENTLDNDYEKLMKQRSEEFKVIDRV